MTKFNISNGKILILIGVLHTLFGISPFAFGKQFSDFASKFFFKISNGVSELPILNGQTNFENATAFWFFYYGILIIPLGILVNSIEKDKKLIPLGFVWSYLIIVLIGVYMIPFSGMTVFMLPHAIYMLLQRLKQAKS